MQRRTQWLIERATHAMLHWLSEAERLAARYERRMAEEANRATTKDLRQIDGKVAWAGTVEAKDLISNGIWAHRKVRSYAAVVQALSARAAVLGDAAKSLDGVLDNPRTYRGVFDYDPTPGELQPPKPPRQFRPWAWDSRNQHTA